MSPFAILVRRNVTARDARRAMYGHEARPLGDIVRHEWARMLAFYVNSGRVTYPGCIEAARRFGEDVRARGFPPLVPENDAQLRRELSARLATRSRRPALSPAALRAYRVKAAIRETLCRARGKPKR